MSDTSFDTSELTRTAGQIQTLAAESKVVAVATTVGLLVNKSWGDDAIGTAFASVYQPAAQEVMRNVLDEAPHLGEIGDKLKASSGRYSDTEDTNEGSANGVEV